jgi:hypothetical protein
MADQAILTSYQIKLFGVCIPNNGVNHQTTTNGMPVSDCQHRGATQVSKK